MDLMTAINSLGGDYVSKVSSAMKDSAVLGTNAKEISKGSNI